MGQSEEQAGKLSCYAVGNDTLTGFPHLDVVGRWPATPKRARYSALIVFSR